VGSSTKDWLITSVPSQWIDYAASTLSHLKVKGPDIPQLSGKPEQTRFTMQSGVHTGQH